MGLPKSRMFTSTFSVCSNSINGGWQNVCHSHACDVIIDECNYGYNSWKSQHL